MSGPTSSELDLLPQLYHILGAEDMGGFHFPPDLVVPTVDAHSDLFIQQQLVGDDDDALLSSPTALLPPQLPPEPPSAALHKRAKRAVHPLFASSASASSSASPPAPSQHAEVQQQQQHVGSSGAKVRAACSNCRASHVACSHDVPCKRCVEHGIEATCRYLPRKKRTNFKKRKVNDALLKDDDEDDEDPLPPHDPASLVDREAALKMEELRRNPPSSLLEGGQPVDAGLWNATLNQLFGAEYAFPLINTNVPAHSQPKDYGLPLLPAGSSSPQTHSSSPQSSPQSGDSSSSSSEDLWLSQLIGESSPTSTSAPSSPGFALPSGGAMTLYDQHGNQSLDRYRNAGMVQLAPMPTTGYYKPQQPPIAKPASPAPPPPLSPGSVSSRTVSLLQEMKAKNERLERLLRDALDDIKELKRREKLREYHNITTQSLVQLHTISPADEFRQAVPALAMFALSAERHGAILQANETFRNMVGYSFDQLATPGFTCCKLFPERFKSKLCKDYNDIMSGARSSGQDDLAILRGDGREIPVRAFFHVIYDDVGRPLYKMFYAFPL